MVDFEKAFDTVDHTALWSVHASHFVPLPYINILLKLYRKHIVTVATDVESRAFGLHKGVKQGGPISALLFILVMDRCMQNLKCKWYTANTRRPGLHFGLHVDGPDTLTNLRFADDILLLASSRPDIRKMLTHLKHEAATYGLRLHMGKTKVLTNCTLSERGKSLEVDGDIVRVLDPSDVESYLGCKLCAVDTTNAELSQRIAGAWAAFSTYKPELTNKNLSAKLRLKLFDAIVTPRVLYASALRPQQQCMSAC